jgi:hypothetical protein
LDNEKEREYEERMTVDAFGVLEIDLDDSWINWIKKY